MCPRTDNETRSGCDCGRGITPNSFEITKLTRQERIEPAGHQQSRCFCRGSAILSIDLTPVRVVLRMAHPIAKELDLGSYGSLVRLQNWPPLIRRPQSALGRPIRLVFGTV